MGLTSSFTDDTTNDNAPYIGLGNPATLDDPYSLNNSMIGLSSDAQRKLRELETLGSIDNDLKEEEEKDKRSGIVAKTSDPSAEQINTVAAPQSKQDDNAEERQRLEAAGRDLLITDNPNFSPNSGVDQIDDAVLRLALLEGDGVPIQDLERDVALLARDECKAAIAGLKGVTIDPLPAQMSGDQGVVASHIPPEDCPTNPHYRKPERSCSDFPPFPSHS